MNTPLPTRKLLVAAPVGLAAVVTTGLLAFPAGVAAAAGDDQVVKRDEDTPAVTTTLDDDDDDAGTDTGTGTNANTGTDTGGTDTGTGTNTGDQNDPTNSRVTGVTSDADASRADLTTDLTNDGPGKNNPDDSRHDTNDASRNDTRG